MHKHDLRLHDGDQRGHVIGRCRICGLSKVDKDGICSGVAYGQSNAVWKDPTLGVLHCVVFFELLEDGNIERRTVYIHGEDVQDVRLKFWRHRQNIARHINIAGIAPAIGYFVQDNQGMALSAN